ncbi:hypothetical protein CRG98_020569 [Punica granatum]|uniref:Uncharacterized protein n=1 Tax=Punica granatum TaxID=22663 RepID=A0A2I0JRZ1_PUNGR|nr:hypothetical protein CRG98_020569 [Punica granatum]
MTEEAWTRRRAEMDGDDAKVLSGLELRKSDESGFGRLKAECGRSGRHAPEGEMRAMRSAVAVAVAASITELHQNM